MRIQNALFLGVYGAVQSTRIYELITGAHIDSSYREHYYLAKLDRVLDTIMRHVGTFEAKNRLSALLDMVEAGEEVVITRNGRPVARLVPPLVDERKAKAREAAEWIKANRSKNSLGDISLKDLIEEGRRF